MSSTRDRLVDAALEALGDLTPGDLLGAVGAAEIARRAGTSKAALFYHFASLDELAEAVLARVFDPGTIDVETIAAGIAGIRRAGLPVEAALAMHSSEFHRITQDPMIRLRLGVWSLGGEGVDPVYRAFLLETEARVYDAAEELFHSWGRELRPPYDHRAFHAVHVALLNGTAVRHLVDPAPHNHDRFVRAAASLTMMALRVRGDRRDLDDRLAEMNYYPRSDAVSAADGTERQQQVRALVLDAAARLIGIRGYDEVTVDMVARSAGVSTSSVYAHFAGKAAIAVALFRKQVADWLWSRGPGEGAPAERLLRHLTLLARFVGRHTPQAGPYLSQVVCHVPDPGEDVLRATTEALVHELAAAGTLRAGLPPVFAAETLVATTLSRVLGDPSERAEDVAALAMALVT